MIGWHHQLNGHEFEQALGDGEGWGILACWSLWGRKESDTTEQMNKNCVDKEKQMQNLRGFKFIPPNLNLLLAITLFNLNTIL